MSSNSMPLIGDKCPVFEAKTTHGMISFPNDARYDGKWIVLFSHPADFTPVCTTEFMAFQQRKEEFNKLGAELIGLSIDQVFSHIKWVEWIKEKMNVDIEFPIIADHGDIGSKFGMVHPGAGSSTVRAVFIIDPAKNIRAILYYPAELGRNMDEILRMIKGFKVAEEKKVAMPAHWPENDFLGDKVIVPPATNVVDAKARLEDKSIDCYDWWFCTKDL